MCNIRATTIFKHKTHQVTKNGKPKIDSNWNTLQIKYYKNFN